MAGKKKQTIVAAQCCTMCGVDMPQQGRMRIRVPKLLVNARWPGYTQTVWDEDWCEACSASFIVWFRERKLEGEELFKQVLSQRFRWALKWDHCRICEKTNRPHKARGLCDNCYVQNTTKGARDRV